MPTCPLDYDETGTALNAVAALSPEVLHVGEGGLEGGLIHRLDTGTSGVLVFATRDDAWHRARAAFAARRVRKAYVARVHGRLDKARRSEIHVKYASWLVMIPVMFAPVLLGPGCTILAIALLSLLCYREFARATGSFCSGPVRRRNTTSSDR